MRLFILIAPIAAREPPGLGVTDQRLVGTIVFVGTAHAVMYPAQYGRPRAVSMLSATLDARPISQDQVVYVSTEFTHNEIPLCGIRLQLHCMQPLAERHRDTECIIDRKPKVEQVEAVNPEIMQEVAVGRDSAAWNVTIQCNNVRNNV